MKFLYDVFLSHNSIDKPSVEILAEKLETYTGIRVFLDKWNLIPGDPWQEDLEKALEKSKTVAIFLGPSGIGGWHNEEMRVALDRRVKNNKLRVIPVLLPGIKRPDRNELPSFLTRLTWVDFSMGVNDDVAFKRLVAGIKGKAPGKI